MPWLKSGDNAATYPLLLALGFVDEADDRTLNEVSGWLWRCSMQSAGHMTDGTIDAGTAQLMGGSRTHVLIAAALEAGLITRIEGATPPRWQIVEDPEFIHIRSKESVLFDRQRDRDRKNPDLTMPVRLRDGDACRFCQQVVNFGARTGGRSGTYEHLQPGVAATVETYVVCCRSCNSSMKDGARLELKPPPTDPFYHPGTLELLAKHGYPIAGHRSEHARAGEGLHRGGSRRDTARPATEDTAAQRDPDPAASGAIRSPQQGANLDEVPPWEEEEYLRRQAAPQPPQRPARAAPTGGDQERPGKQGGIPDGSGRDGTGQVGKGRAGSGRDGPGRSGAVAAQRRRGRRGRRRGGPAAGGGGSR